jgi:hypothetical protein
MTRHDNVAEVFAAIQRMKDEGLVKEYALGGAMALIFWSEPVATFDVDIFVILDSPEVLVSLAPIYGWAARQGYPTKAEHIIIAEVPVQVIPAHNAVAVEAIERAVELDYQEQRVRVIRLEYLIAMYLEPNARSQKRLLRVAALLEEGEVDRAALDDLLKRHNLQLPEQR